MSLTATADCPAPAITVKELLSLLKPRVMSLVVFTGLIGMAIAPGAGMLHPFIQLLIVGCIALGSGAGGAINMWYDRDIDAIMKRTQRRPIPSGKIAPDDVLTGGIMLSVITVMLLGMATNWVAAGWLAFAIFFYSVIYTMGLKRRTPQNIVIGGAAGAFPPVIGWAAVTGSTPLEPWLLFAIIFFWTPPHFWALALNCNEDYTRARIPMLPVSHGPKRTVREMALHTVFLAIAALSPAFFAGAGYAYIIPASLITAVFMWLVWRVYQQPDSRSDAKRLFGFSILYLFVIFALIGFDSII